MANINHELSLYHFTFLPQNQKEQIPYLNGILRPNVAKLCEFAGLERALVGNTIARGEPFSHETMLRIKHYRSIVEQYLAQVLILKGQASTSKEKKQAIVTFEKEFLYSFQLLREKIFAASRNQAAYPVDATTWFDAATKAIDTGLAISNVASTQAKTITYQMEQAAKINLTISFFLLVLVLLIFYIFTQWSKNRILTPIQKLISITQKMTAGDFSQRVATSSEDGNRKSSQKRILGEYEPRNSYSYECHYWLEPTRFQDQFYTQAGRISHTDRLIISSRQ